MARTRQLPSAIRGLKGKPRDEWPSSFKILWDFSAENFHLAEDGVSPDEFAYDEYLLGEADLADIDVALHGASRRAASELWTIASDKVAGAILHWSNGGLMTPPLLDVNMGCLVIAGGNNRIAVCRTDGQKRLPFLYLAEKAELFAAKLESFTPVRT